MARTKVQKKEIIEKLHSIVNEAKSLVFVNIHGLGVNDAVSMRKKLRSEGVGLFVAKKSLTGRVLADKKFSGEIPQMPGEIALAFGPDSVAPAREVYQFQKKHIDQVVITGGVFENSYMDKQAMTTIASIPSLSVLRGMFVNIINSPIQRMVVVIDAIAKKKI